MRAIARIPPTSRLLHRTIDYSYDALSRLLQADNWHYPAQDALGSVRAAFDDTATIQHSVNYSSIGVSDTPYDGFAFTGEQLDSNGLQYHRARYYDPALGVWASLDPLETPNRYGYVSGNFINDAVGELINLLNPA